MTKVLFITQHFPPAGGAGVQRPAKFVKYLPECGIEPFVLAGVSSKSNRWTPGDNSLVADIPVAVRVVRDQVDPGSTDQSPRARLRSMIELGDALIRDHKLEVILVTMSPFDHCELASELSARHGIPWIADLRDPWALDEFQVHRTRWHRARERMEMRRRLHSATSIIMNTPEARQKLCRAFPELAGKAVVSITNGYDPDDFRVSPKVMLPGRMNIVHSGYFHADHGLRQRRRRAEYALLGRTHPGVRLLPRSHYYLLKAVESWVREEPSMQERVAVVCLGVASPVDQALVNASPCAGLFTFTGYKPHSECLEYVQGADLLFLPMHAMPKGERASIVPGKTYEYLASGVPILAAVPEGDARDFIRAADAGWVCDPEDTECLLRSLKEQFVQWSGGRRSRRLLSPAVTRFERRALTQVLAEEIQRVKRLVARAGK